MRFSIRSAYLAYTDIKLNQYFHYHRFLKPTSSFLSCQVFSYINTISLENAYGGTIVSICSKSNNGKLTGVNIPTPRIVCIAPLLEHENGVSDIYIYILLLDNTASRHLKCEQYIKWICNNMVNLNFTTNYNGSFG